MGALRPGVSTGTHKHLSLSEDSPGNTILTQPTPSPNHARCIDLSEPGLLCKDSVKQQRAKTQTPHNAHRLCRQQTLVNRSREVGKQDAVWVLHEAGMSETSGFLQYPECTEDSQQKARVSRGRQRQLHRPPTHDAHSSGVGQTRKLPRQERIKFPKAQRTHTSWRTLWVPTAPCRSGGHCSQQNPASSGLPVASTPKPWEHQGSRVSCNHDDLS